MLKTQAPPMAEAPHADASVIDGAHAARTPATLEDLGEHQSGLEALLMDIREPVREVAEIEHALAGHEAKLARARRSNRVDDFDLGMLHGKVDLLGWVLGKALDGLGGVLGAPCPMPAR